MRRRWWGWIDPPRGAGLSASALEALALELGPRRDTPAVSLDDVTLPDRSLPQRGAERLASIVGPENVDTGRLARVLHAAGRSYLDLITLRRGDASTAPDAVVHPSDEEAVAEVLRTCAEENVAVVPFGGGTSVVGGVTPQHAGFAGVISLDVDGLDDLTVDRTSLIATGGGGLPIPRAEARLQARGLTLGHFPQSFELATLGGCVATRSAGQASTGYGRIDKLLVGASVQTPAGQLAIPIRPPSAAGPRLAELVAGSEGTLGVICEAAVRVRPLPAARRYLGWSFRRFDDGIEAFRTLAQRHAAPDVARLSDHDETRLTLALSASEARAQQVGQLYLRARGHAGGCLAITGFEGEPAEVDDRVRRARIILEGCGALSLGSRPGETWLRSRYAAPYLRDDLLDSGYLAETLETAATWSRLQELYGAVRDALRGALESAPALVGCHISHLYPEGASLYYTILARRDLGAEDEQWEPAKRAAGDAIERHGGTITHHHAVGRDHAPWMRDEAGDVGLALLRAAKSALDPTGIMNPGKLIPAP